MFSEPDDEIGIFEEVRHAVNWIWSAWLKVVIRWTAEASKAEPSFGFEHTLACDICKDLVRSSGFLFPIVMMSKERFMVVDEEPDHGCDLHEQKEKLGGLQALSDKYDYGESAHDEGAGVHAD